MEVYTGNIFYSNDNCMINVGERLMDFSYAILLYVDTIHHSNTPDNYETFVVL